MENQVKKFINDLKQVSLESTEKAVLRARLISELALTTDLEPVPKVSWSFISFRWRLVAMPLVAVLIVGSTISAAAGKSLPGQFLYPVKVGVNEELGRWLNSTLPEQVFEYESSLLSRRLAEAEQLDNLNKLDSGLKVLVRENIIKQQTKVTEVVRLIAPAEAIGASSEVAVSPAGAELSSIMVSDQPDLSLKTADDSLPSVTATTSQAIVVTEEKKEISPVKSRLGEIINTHQQIMEKLEIQINKTEILPSVGSLKDTLEDLVEDVN